MQPNSELKVVSVNVGLPREVEWQGQKVTTGIFKKPVDKPIQVKQLNLEGDHQADLIGHGGYYKAMYVYPVEYYDFWKQELAEPELEWGMFGENLSTLGLLDNTVNIGDCFRVGTAEIMVTEPRVPCYKLNLKFGRNDIIKRMTKSGYTGFYVAVTKEGEVGAGDVIIPLTQDENKVKVTDISRLYFHDRKDQAAIQRALQVPTLSPSWKDFFQRLL